MAYLLGIDIGTTGARALLVDERGRLVGSASDEYPLYTPQPQWAEQDPADWWRGAVTAVRHVLSETGIDPRRSKAWGSPGRCTEWCFSTSTAPLSGAA